MYEACEGKGGMLCVMHGVEVKNEVLYDML